MAKKTKSKKNKKNREFDKLMANSSFIHKPTKTSFLTLTAIALISGFVGGLSSDYINDNYFTKELENPKPNTITKEASPLATPVNKTEQNFASKFLAESMTDLEQAEKSVINLFIKKESTDEDSIIESIYLPNEIIGQGFVLTSDGWIVSFSQNFTSKTKETFVATTNDNKSYEVSDIIIDEVTGLAFFKLNAQNLSVAQLSSIKNNYKGDSILQIDQNNSFTLNAISNTHYSPITTTSDLFHSSEEFYHYISLNISNKNNLLGSPIFSKKGEIIGILINPTNDGISRALPIDVIKPILKNIFKENKAIRPYLGITYLDIQELEGLQTKNITNLDYIKKGALIQGQDGNPAIKKDSPAEKAGLKEGDIILKVENDEVNNTHSLTYLIQEYSIGSTIKILILRDSIEQEIEVILEESK